MGKDVSMSEVSMVCLATHDDLNMWLWELAAKGYVFSKYALSRILLKMRTIQICGHNLLPQIISRNSVFILMLFLKLALQCSAVY